MLHNDSDKDGNVSSECEEGDGTDCEDGEWHSYVKVDRVWRALCTKCMN